MNYIVFDLEWNQNPEGKKTRNDKLPFEIIDRSSKSKQQKRNHRQLPQTDPATGL